MTETLLLLFLFAAPVPSSLDQVRADNNPEHRARLAVDFSMAAEKRSEAAYEKGDMAAVTARLKDVEDGIVLAEESFAATGKTPGRHPGPYKYAELRSRELLIRLADLERRMDSGERSAVVPAKTRIQEIHDTWFEGIMGKKK